MTAPATLREIRRPADGRSYPRHLLKQCEDALVLFAAGFHGRQDAYWVADAGLQATCVDKEGDLLFEMAAVYPDGWEFQHTDAFEFARWTGQMWDLVSVDCPSTLFERCAREVGLWCDIARKAVVLGTGGDTVVNVPSGWTVTETRRRSDNYGGCFWTVLEHA